MQIQIVNNNYIYFNNITDEHNSILFNEMTFVDPNAKYMNQNRPWQGKFRKYDLINKKCLLTFLPRIVHICKKNNIPFVIEDLRDKWNYYIVESELINENYLPGIKLEDYQIAAIKKALQIEFGIYKAVTGSGKTEMIAGICKSINCPTVILADMTVVVSQLKERLQLRNVAEEIGLFFAGEKPNGEMIVVGSVQSLAAPSEVGPSPSIVDFPDEKKYEKAVQKWQQKRDAYNTRKRNYRFLIEYIKKAEMLIVDECVDENSFIHTSNGLCTAKSIYDKVINGEKIYVNSLNSNNLIIGASDKYDNYIEIVTSKNRSLKTSENHKFAVFVDGYRIDKYASDLLPGDLLLINNNDYNIITNWSNNLTWLWYFVGLFIGDGHLLNGRQVKFGVRKDHDDWIDVITKISNLFGCDFRYSFNNRNDLTLRLKSHIIVQFLNSLGFSKGRKMGNIDPKFDVDSEFICALIRGLFDSEGTAYSDCCHFDSADLKLAKYVQNALAYIGISSNLFVSNHRKSIKHAKCWRVSITASNYNEFIRLVGFGFNRKSAKIVGGKSLLPNRFINPKYYIDKWLKFIPLKVLKKILQRRDFTSNVNLQMLIDWQNKIIKLSEEHVNSYDSAKSIYSISYNKIACFDGRSTMTIFNLIKNGSNIWMNYVNFIKKQLSIIIIDNKLFGYSVEPVKTCLKSTDNIRLIDFAVENINSFDVNGFLVHNCDRSASDTYKKVIRTHFKGRRKYGFCLSGKTILNTINGEMKLSEFTNGDQIILLSGNNSYQTGTVIETGYKPSFEVSFDNGLKLTSSKDHYLANDLGDYIRVDDIIPGQRIKIDNYRLIYNLKSLSDIISVLDSSFNLCDISIDGFEFSRSNLEQEIVCTEIDDIFSQPVEFVIDSGKLWDEFNIINIHESHKQKFIGRSIINQFSIRSHVISSFEFSWEFEPTRTISFRQCITDFLSDCNIINGVSAEFFYHDLISFFDISRNFECNGETVSFYHCILDSFDDFIDLHRVFNTISLRTSSPSFNLVIEKFISVPFFFDRPACYLIFVDGKPIINAVFFEHFLFVSFISSVSLIDATRQIISAFRAQMSVEFSDLYVWSIFRAFKNAMAVVTLDGDNVMIPSLSIVSSSINNSHSDFSLSQGVKRSLYICNDITTVSSVEILSSEKMYDIINVSNTSNFIANSILVHNSATPYDDSKPIKNINIEENFGPIVFEMNRTEIEDRGRIIPCKYRSIVYEDPMYDLHNKITLDEATNMFMVNNNRFHDIIFGICNVHKGERNMILTERIPLGENLLARAQELGLNARFIYGLTSKTERDKIINEFSKGQLDVLIGGKIINRGLDIKGGVDNLIIATGGKLRSDFLQKIGRALRVNNRGFSYVYDFLFRCNHYLYEHSKARLLTIIDAGYESKVLFGYTNLDGKELVRRNFKSPSRQCNKK